MKKLIISLMLLCICRQAPGVVNTTAVPERFPANGSSTTFNFTFRLTDQTEMQALVRVDATGVDTELELNVDYTLSATNNDFGNGGTLTTTETYSAGNTLILHREVLRTQTVNLIQGQAMPAESTEITFDKQTMGLQDIDKNLIFYIRVPKGDPATALELTVPSSEARKNRTFTWDANGNPAATDVTTGVTVSAYAETYLDDTSEGAFKATTNLETGTDVQGWDAQLDDIAALAVTNSNIIVGDGNNWVAESGATARASLGLTIGTDVHAFTANGNTIITDAGILAIAGLTTAADKMIYTTALDTYATTDLTSFARTLNDDATAAAARTTLGVTAATDVIDRDGSVAYTGTGDGFKDEDNMSSDSATATASQQSIKKYVDDQVVDPREYVRLHDSKATTTAGGTFTAGAWQKRTVTEDTDTGNNVSVSSSVIVLDAGTYECFITCPAFRVNAHQARLRNTTGGSTVLLGTNNTSDNATSSGSLAVIQGRFTIAASQNLEIQHRSGTTHASNGFGVANSFGENEIYTVAEFWKI